MSTQTIFEQFVSVQFDDYKRYAFKKNLISVGIFQNYIMAIKQRVEEPEGFTNGQLITKMRKNNSVY